MAVLGSPASPIGKPVLQGSAIEAAGRPPVAVTAALQALPATDRRLLAGRAWRTDPETALSAGCYPLRGVRLPVE